MRAVLRSMQGRPLYLWVTFAIPALAIFGHAVAPGKAILKGQDLGIVVAWAATVLAIALWIPYRRMRPWPTSVFVFLGVTTGAWLYQLVRTQWDQSLFNLTAFTVPVLLAMVAIKPVSRREADVGLLVLGYSLLGITVASLVFGAIGWMPSGFDASDAGGQRIPVLDLIGAYGRWAGPFQSVNYASPAGGLLIIIGVTRRGWHRWVLTGGGLAILVLGQGRAALFAVAAGLLIAVLWSPLVSRLRQARVVRWAAFGTAIALAGVYIAVIDPTFNGRTAIWTDFLSLLAENPVFGIGDSGVVDYVRPRVDIPGLVTQGHAHSVLLDGLVRYGLIMAILTLTIYALAIRAGLRSLRDLDAAPLAIIVFVIVVGVPETLHSWNYWTVYTAALTWAVIHAYAPPVHTKDSLSAEGSLSLSGG